MEDKKYIKVSLGTLICILVIIILLVIALLVMYYHYNNNQPNINNNNLPVTKQIHDNSENIVSKDDIIETSIRNYIFTDFGPQNNINNVTIDSYKEISSEQYFSQIPGSPWTEKEKSEYLKYNPDLMYGYCTFTIELINLDDLIMEGSKPGYYEIRGNNFMSEAVFTFNKKTTEVNFVTTYGFGNKTELLSNEQKKSDQEIVKELFIENYLEPWISENSSSNTAITDYKIDKITIVSGDEKNNIKEIFTNATENAIFAYVNYSVKLKDINSYVSAGNGEIYNGWDTNKTQCVNIDIIDGEYVFNCGTSW